MEQALQRGEYRLALEQLSSSGTRDGRWHWLASQAYDGLNDPAKAVAEAEEALKLDPNQPLYHVHLAQIFLSRNTPQAALEILIEAEARFPDAFLIHLGKGLALKELQLYEQAQQELRWCLARQPASALAFDGLATIYLQQQRFGDARTLALQFMEQNAADYRGYYFLAAGREGGSLSSAPTRALLKQALERNPSFAAGHALMGKILLREEHADEAIPYLKKAVELRPDLVQAHLHLARAFRILGNDKASTQEFEIVRQLKAKEQQPVPSLLYHRGSR